MIRRLWWVFVVVVLAVLILVIFVRDAQAPPNPVALPLNKTFDQAPTGFTLNYPDEWEVMYPSGGVAVFGPTQTLYASEPGPTFTVQRVEPLSVVGTLDGAMDRYLKNGPLATPDLWNITQAVAPAQLDGRDALAVTVQGSESVGAPEQDAHIVVTSANNTFVYIFIASVPVEKASSYEPTFEAILQSVKILE